MKLDTVLKLRELRRMRGLSQTEVAERSGVGKNTLSSFESGKRLDSMKLVQLEKILAAYGVTCAEFFGSTVSDEIVGQTERVMDVYGLQRKLHVLPDRAQKILLEKFDLMISTAQELV